MRRSGHSRPDGAASRNSALEPPQPPAGSRHPPGPPERPATPGTPVASSAAGCRASDAALHSAAVTDQAWLRAAIPALRDLVRVARDDRLLARVGRDAGVTVPTHLVLVLTRVGDFQPVRLSELADQMGMGRTTVSRQISDLVAAGLVRRVQDPHDARAATLHLTDDGARALGLIWSAWVRLLAQVTDPWTADERSALPPLLDRLARTLEALSET